MIVTKSTKSAWISVQFDKTSTKVSSIKSSFSSDSTYSNTPYFTTFAILLGCEFPLHYRIAHSHHIKGNNNTKRYITISCSATEKKAVLVLAQLSFPLHCNYITICVEAYDSRFIDNLVYVQTCSLPDKFETSGPTSRIYRNGEGRNSAKAPNTVSISTFIRHGPFDILGGAWNFFEKKFPCSDFD